MKSWILQDSPPVYTTANHDMFHTRSENSLCIVPSNPGSVELRS